jgi:phospholipid/cholesterol/gamma-HCH transport system substrate-binding protein
MKRAVKAHATDFAAIIGLIVVALAVSLYIVHHERLRIPFIDGKQFTINAEFTTGQAVVAGQGQTVQVHGVRIGDIGGVTLKDGRAVIQMKLDPEYKDLVHEDATALLRPKTGLKDMFVDLDPGTQGRPVKAGFTIPIRNTQPDVNPDEFYSALDSDTRDYLKLLLQGAGKGLEGRAPDLQDVFARFEPTHRDLARVNGAVAERRQNLRRLIHSLRLLNTALADNAGDVTKLVDSSSQVLHQFASEEAAISESVQRLPGTLRTTTSTLNKVNTYATLLRPTAEKLRPAVRAIDPANKAVIPAANELTPLLQKNIRPFVRDTQPLIRDIKAPATRLAAATPNLTGSFEMLNHLFNLVAFNPNGAEAPDAENKRQEGYLFWIAWIDHMALNLFSNSDAHGTFRPTTVGAPCNTFNDLVTERPEMAFLQGLSGLLVGACGITS